MYFLLYKEILKCHLMAMGNHKSITTINILINLDINLYVYMCRYICANSNKNHVLVIIPVLCWSTEEFFKIFVTIWLICVLNNCWRIETLYSSLRHLILTILVNTNYFCGPLLDNIKCTPLFTSNPNVRNFILMLELPNLHLKNLDGSNPGCQLFMAF